MSDPSDFEITDAMLCFGGSFVAALGALWRLADDDNRGRLKAAFEDYFREYAELAQLKAERAS